jgi:hypothetical protein
MSRQSEMPLMSVVIAAVITALLIWLTVMRRVTEMDR